MYEYPDDNSTSVFNLIMKPDIQYFMYTERIQLENGSNRMIRWARVSDHFGNDNTTEFTNYQKTIHKFINQKHRNISRSVGVVQSI